jgi:hypothetical protein
MQDEDENGLKNGEGEGNEGESSGSVIKNPPRGAAGETLPSPRPYSAAVSRARA